MKKYLLFITICLPIFSKETTSVSESELLKEADLFCSFKVDSIINNSKTFAKIRNDSNLLVSWQVAAHITRLIFGRQYSILKIQCKLLEGDNFEIGKEYLSYLCIQKDSSFSSGCEYNHCAGEFHEDKIFWFSTINSTLFQHKSNLSINEIEKRTKKYLKDHKLNKLTN